MGRFDAVDIIDPGRRIRNDHASVLILSGSPSHLSFPRKRRFFAWFLCRMRSFRPSSTVSFFVFQPDTDKARFIKSSSITIFVRIVPL
jgi:hypothetical protein